MQSSTAQGRAAAAPMQAEAAASVLFIAAIITAILADGAYHIIRSIA
jgi:hypothetical protein